jgi:hypothetical protein
MNLHAPYRTHSKIVIAGVKKPTNTAFTYKLGLAISLFIGAFSAFAQNPADRDTAFRYHVSPTINHFSGSASYRNLAIQPDGKIIYVVVPEKVTFDLNVKSWLCVCTYNF